MTEEHTPWKTAQWFTSPWNHAPEVTADFAFPDRIQNAMLTVSLNNFYTWTRESPFGTWALENFGNDGLGGTEPSGISSNERIPAPTTLRMSLRLTF